jgi:hypothetical protein
MSDHQKEIIDYLFPNYINGLVERAARHAAEAMREKAAQIERDVYFRLIGSEAMPCACGNGRIPTTSFSDATRTYAAAICAIPIEGDMT